MKCYFKKLIMRISVSPWFPLMKTPVCSASITYLKFKRMYMIIHPFLKVDISPTYCEMSDITVIVANVQTFYPFMICELLLLLFCFLR